MWTRALTVAVAIAIAPACEEQESPECQALKERYEAELASVRLCEVDDQCGQTVPSRCGGWRDLVARNDADLTALRALLAEGEETGCQLQSTAPCRERGTDGFYCPNGECRWRLEDFQPVCRDDMVPQAGRCRNGECLPELNETCANGTETRSEYCCKPWQTCTTLLECESAHPETVGDDCVSEDNCEPGEFCSSGFCFLASEYAACVSSTDCGAEQRCDTTETLCVPDLGGCQWCDGISEVCCEPTQTCGSDGHCSQD